MMILLYGWFRLCCDQPPCTIAQKIRVHRTVIFNQYICDKFHPTFRHDSRAPLVPNPLFQNNPTVQKCNKTTIHPISGRRFFTKIWSAHPNHFVRPLPFKIVVSRASSTPTNSGELMKCVRLRKSDLIIARQSIISCSLPNQTTF